LIFLRSGYVELQNALSRYVLASAVSLFGILREFAAVLALLRNTPASMVFGLLIGSIGMFSDV